MKQLSMNFELLMFKAVLSEIGMKIHCKRSRIISHGPFERHHLELFYRVRSIDENHFSVILAPKRCCNFLRFTN